MRFVELRLQAWGPFTDVTLDLSGGSHGLHVVYGTNEAGKSTTLRAVRAVLFGVPHRTQDAHLHDHAALRLGATLRNAAGQELSFGRRKGRKNTVLNAAGETLDPAELDSFLGGLSAEGFAGAFAIGHAELREGGRALAQGRGDVGESLFAASLGGAGLRKVLEDLEDEAGTLFRFRGQTQQVNVALTRFKSARQRVREAALASSEWAGHQDALDRAESERDKLAAEIDAVRRQRERLERLGRCVSLVAQRRELRTSRDGLGDVPKLRPDAAEARRRAEQGLTAAEQAAARAAQAAENVADELADLEVPEALLTAGDQISDLHQRLGSMRKAAADRGKLLSRAAALRQEAGAALGDAVPGATLDDLEARRPTAGARRNLRALIARANSVREASQRTANDLDRRRKSLGEAPAGAPEELAAAVQRARGIGDPEASAQEARIRAETREAALRAAAGRLNLVPGDDLASVAGLPLPTSEDIETHAGRVETFARRRARLDDQQAELQAGEEELEATLAKLERGGAVPTEEELTAAREARDVAWAALRGNWAGGEALDDANADAFEKAVSEADGRADTLRADADRAARKSELLRQGGELETRRERLHDDDKTLAAEQATWAQDWAGEWASAGRVPTSPEAGRALRSDHDDFAGRWDELLGLREQAASAQASAARIRSELTEGLKAVGDPAQREGQTLAALLDICELRVRRSEQDASRYAVAARELVEAKEAQAAAQAELASWREAWAGAVTPLGLRADADVEAAEAVMEGLEAAAASQKEAAGLADRVAKIDADAVAFAKDVSALALAEPGAEPGGAVASLHRRLQVARKAEGQRDELGRKRKELLATRDEEEGKAEHLTEELASLCRDAGVPQAADLAAVEERAAEATSLEARTVALAERLHAEGAGATLDALVAEVEALDADALPGRIEALKRESAEQEVARSELDVRIGSERSLLERMDGAATAAEAEEEAAEALAEVRATAERFVRVKLAHGVLKRAIESYRREHQEPLLRRAGELFTDLTLGSFAGLRTDIGADDEPVLVGVRPKTNGAEGPRVPVEAMSDGSRDQLYLALRLAAVEAHAASGECLPLLVDDVLVHFDEDRARAALAALAELSTTTQVVLFTHHERTAELAAGLPAPAEVFVRTLGAHGGVRSRAWL